MMIHKQLKNRNKKSRFFVAAAIEAPVKLFLGRRCGSSRDLLRNFAGGGCLRIHFAPAQQQLEPSATLVRGTGPYGLLSEEKISTLVSAFSPSTDTDAHALGTYPSRMLCTGESRCQWVSRVTLSVPKTFNDQICSVMGMRRELLCFSKSPTVLVHFQIRDAEPQPRPRESCRC